MTDLKTAPAYPGAQAVQRAATQNNGDAHLRLEGVTKRFGAASAVNNVTLHIPQGTFATLLGPSGCGKTTLLRLIAGFYEPDAGEIYLDSERIDRLAVHRRGTAMVFQDYALFPHMRVFDNVAYGLRLAKLPREQVKERVVDALRLVDLTGLEDRWPNQLSGGQQQRVALARALVVHPKVLLLDEPMSNLDANLRERMRWELRALQQKLNITFLYVTHDQSEAFAMSDWVAVMNRGNVEQWGTPWEIYYHPRTPFMADFVGAANLQPATIRLRENQELVVALDDLDVALRLPDTSNVAAHDKVLLCIRPETLTITAPGANEVVPGGEDTRHALPAMVLRHVFLGQRMRYWVRIGSAEWVVDQSDPGGASGHFEGEVRIWLNPARVQVIKL